MSIDTAITGKSFCKRRWDKRKSIIIAGHGCVVALRNRILVVLGAKKYWTACLYSSRQRSRLGFTCLRIWYHGGRWRVHRINLLIFAIPRRGCFLLPDEVY